MYFYILLILVLTEQVLYFFLNKYPCHYGLLVNRKYINNIKQLIPDTIGKVKYKNIVVRKESQKDDTFLRYKYSIFQGGPFLFVGQIKCDEENVVHIRIGYLTATLMGFLLFILFHENVLYTIGLSIGAIYTIFCFYRRFIISINQAVNEKTLSVNSVMSETKKINDEH